MAAGKKRRGSRKRPVWPTRLAAVLIAFLTLPILVSGLRFAAIELEAFGAFQQATLLFYGRVLDEETEARMRGQLLDAAAARPTRARLEWVSGALALAHDSLHADERAASARFLTQQLARNPASHLGWARLSAIELKQGDKAASGQFYRGAFVTGAYLPSSAIWAVGMGQRNWLYLGADMRQGVETLTYDLFAFAPAATATIAGPKWRELYMRSALAHDPAALRSFERYLKLYFHPSYNRQ